MPKPCVCSDYGCPSSLYLWSVVWQAKIPCLPYHPSVEGAGVSSAKEASAAQIEYMVLPISKIALAALQGPEIHYESLELCLLRVTASFLREKSVWMLLETWQDCIRYWTLKYSSI